MLSLRGFLKKKIKGKLIFCGLTDKERVSIKMIIEMFYVEISDPEEINWFLQSIDKLI